MAKEKQTLLMVSVVMVLELQAKQIPGLVLPSIHLVSFTFRMLAKQLDLVNLNAFQSIFLDCGFKVEVSQTVAYSITDVVKCTLYMYS